MYLYVTKSKYKYNKSNNAFRLQNKKHFIMYFGFYGFSYRWMNFSSTVPFLERSLNNLVVMSFIYGAFLIFNSFISLVTLPCVVDQRDCYV